MSDKEDLLEEGFSIVSEDGEDDLEEIVEPDVEIELLPVGKDYYGAIRGKDPLLDTFIVECEGALDDRQKTGRRPKRLTPRQILEAYADKELRADSNRELCRVCRDGRLKDLKRFPEELPYGEETGIVESLPQYDKATKEPLVDENGEQLYVDFPELICAQGHRWYHGEGPRRDIRGVNPILFESHIIDRKRREILAGSGTPDPAFTLDRFGRPIQGIYNRTHPSGRKMNSPEQRKSSGAAFYK